MDRTSRAKQREPRRTRLSFERTISTFGLSYLETLGLIPPYT